MDMVAICNAVAARFAPGTITTPTGGEAMRSAWGQAPHGPKPTPFVVVMPQTGDVIAGGGTYNVTHHVDINFYHSKAQGDVARSEKQRQLWLPGLLGATFGSPAAWTLGGLVKSVIATGYEFIELPYDGDSYDGITIHADIIVRDIPMPT